MNIIAVDDEKLSLEALVSCIKENLPNETVNAFRKTSDAEVYVCRNGCDIAFLDIEMRDVNGIELAKKIQEINSKVNIVFVTGYGDYTGEAFSIFASAYIMNLHARYMNDFEVLSLKNNDYVTTMVLCYTGDVNRLNGLVNKIMRLKGVKKMRFIGF